MSFTIKEGGFGVWDYVAFGVLCAVSCVGGIWYSALGSRAEAVVNVRDYLLGGKTMSTFPVAMSLIASVSALALLIVRPMIRFVENRLTRYIDGFYLLFKRYVSGVTILGTPAEIYNYGIQYWLVIVGVTLSCIIVAAVYLPVFCTLRLSSSYEYLELRFNRYVRAVASVLFLLDEVLFLPMVVYVPALAFNQLTGFNVYAVGGTMVFICGLYTVLGGLRAVVCTDSVQTGVMFVGVLLVAVAGTCAVGGFDAVVAIAKESGRLEISNWDFSPYERQTGWGAVVGGCIYWTCFNSVNQTMVQRYIALPNKRQAVFALAIFCVGAIFAISLCVWCGLAAWGAWVSGGCHPDGVPLVDDRLLPAFVTYVSRVQNLPGLNGVFLAGVFGAGLSSLSAVLNACALVAVEDIIRGWLKLDLKPMTQGIIARLFTAVLAVISLLMLVVVSKLGGVLGVATALSAIAASSTCGIFTLGMVFPWVGPRGAIAGAIAGALMAGTLSFGTQAVAASGLRAPPLNMTTECAKNASYVIVVGEISPEDVFPLFRVSYHWIAPTGLAAALVVGAAVGWLSDVRRHRDVELFTPLVWRWLSQESHACRGDARRRILAKDAKAAAPSTPLIMQPVDKIEINGESSR